MLKVGLYGFGNIAQAHKSAYEECQREGVPVQLTAVCDIRPERLRICEKSNEQINTYCSIETMLEKERLDLIDICLPTYMHLPASIDMLNKGYHVLCEKPMALSSFDCNSILEVARQAKGYFMIGQCLRFSPEYEYLKKLVEEEVYGKVISAFFQRFSGPPLWGWEKWFLDSSKSGGCLQDQHIHDVDIIRYLFGEPISVNCFSTGDKCLYDCVTTHFDYEDKKLIIATSDWGLREGVKFQQDYRVNFEKATLIFRDDILTLYKKMRPPIIVEVEKNNGIKAEIKYFVDMIINKSINFVNPPESAGATVALVEKIRESADGNGIKIFCR